MLSIATTDLLQVFKACERKQKNKKIAYYANIFVLSIFILNGFLLPFSAYACHGSITVEKLVNGTRTTEKFGFEGDFGSFNLKNGERKTFTKSADKTFTISEKEMNGWELEDITCTGMDNSDLIDLENRRVVINLKDGSNVKCVFTNKETDCENNYEIKFLERVLNNDNTSTWTYSVKDNGGKCPAISHWVWKPCYSPEVLSAVFISANPAEETVGLDGSTGNFGVKWDTGSGLGNGVYSITINGQPEIDDSAIGIIKAGAGDYSYALSGPSCGPGPFCGDGIKNNEEECDGTDGLIDDYICTIDCQLVYAPSKGSLKACKLSDADGNLGTTNDREPVTGWNFNLTDGTVNLSDSTGEDGCRIFNDLTAGSYTVSENETEGWKFLEPALGSETVWVKGGEETLVYFINERLADAPYCGDGIINNDEECDDGNQKNNDGCSADCKIEKDGLKKIPVKTCTGEAFLFAYQNSQTQPIKTEFQAGYDQVLVMARSEAVLTAKVNTDSRDLKIEKKLNEPFGITIYSLSVNPGDNISIDGSHKYNARGVQGYLIQDSAAPAYDLATLEIVYDGYKENEMYLSPGDYDYIIYDKYTKHNNGTDDSRPLNVKISGENFLSDLNYTKPNPFPIEGVVIDSFSIAKTGQYNLSIDTKDSVYWLYSHCPVLPICGNDIVEAGEECDGTNGVGENQTCSDACKIINLPYCGDGIKNNNEQCDGTDGVGPNQSCSASCELINLPYCGDGIKNNNEQCDGTEGVGPNQSCSANCELIDLTYCGDGIKNNNEQCDGTEGVGPNQSCSATCELISLPYCGDGIKNNNEQCDGTDGIGVNQSCSASCELVNLPYCGNGIIESGEECDDGNNISGDGCSSVCRKENRGGGGGGGQIFLKISNENVICTAPDTILVSWDTNKPAASRVLYDSNPQINMGVAPNYNYSSTTVTINKSNLSHSFVISGLKKGENYYVKPVSEGSYAVFGKEMIINTNACCQVLGEEGYPVLSINKTVDRVFTNPGDRNIEYKIIVTNEGNMTAFNVVLNDMLPAGLSFESATGTVRDWSLNDLEPGQSKEITYRAIADINAREGTYRNIAIARADNHDPVEDAANLEIRLVQVLPLSGFSRSEALLLGIAVIALFGAAKLSRKEMI